MKKKTLLLVLALLVSSLVCPSNTTKTNVYNNEISVFASENDNCLKGKYVKDEHATTLKNVIYSGLNPICNKDGATYKGDGGVGSGIYCILNDTCYDTGTGGMLCSGYEARWVCTQREESTSSSENNNSGNNSSGSSSSGTVNCKVGTYSSTTYVGQGGASGPKCNVSGLNYNSSYTTCYDATNPHDGGAAAVILYDWYNFTFICEDEWHETDDSYNYAGSVGNGNGSIIGDGEVTCSSLGDFKGDLQNIFKAFKIVAPILTLVLSSVEFLVAVTSKEGEGLKSASKKLSTRLILVAVLFFLPIILNVILDLVFPGASTCIS